MNSKSILALAVGLSLAVFTSTIWAGGTYSGGDGSAENPYRIATPNDLNDIGNHPNDWDKHFILMKDINLADYNDNRFNIIGYITSWFHITPIGVGFAGVFDGNNNVIYNFTYSSTERDNVGLFGFVDDANAEVRNLTLIAPDVNAATKCDVGSLVGVLNAGHVLNCKVEGGNIYGGVNIGGLVGSITSTSGRITNCYSSSVVSGEDGIGGLVGSNSAKITPLYGGTIIKCFASGSVNGDNSIGGLVGFNCWLISDCYASGDVSGIVSYTGGLVGTNYYGTISNCYATGSVEGHDNTGGIVGKNIGGTIPNCYAVGDVDGINSTGGLVGRNISGFLLFNMISNCYAAGDVNGISDTGGLVGSDNSWVSYTSCFWDSDVNPDVNGIGNSSDPNVIGKSTAEMQQESTFTDAGWDFVEVWDIVENETYPFLRPVLKPIPVAVDIKPGSCPNPLNVKSKGVLPVAILGADDFDVNSIDVASTRLEGVAPIRSGYEDVGAPVIDANDCNCSEDGPDGYLDLTLKFKTQEIVEAIGDVNDGDILPLELTGVSFDETPIEGADCILIRGKYKPFNKADINKDGVVDLRDFGIFAENWLQSSIVEE